MLYGEMSRSISRTWSVLQILRAFSARNLDCVYERIYALRQRLAAGLVKGTLLLSAIRIAHLLSDKRDSFRIIPHKFPDNSRYTEFQWKA